MLYLNTNFNMLSWNFMNIETFNYYRLKWYLRCRYAFFLTLEFVLSIWFAFVWFLFHSLGSRGDFKRDVQFQPRVHTNAASHSLCIWLSIPWLHQWFAMCRKLQAESASWNIARVSVKLHTKCSNRKKFHSILFYTVASRKSKSALEQQYKHFI